MNKPITVLVPDIGNYTDVAIIDIAVQVGDIVEIDDILITLETEKTTMDVPTTYAGKIVSLRVNIGDKISAGSVIAEIEPLANENEIENEQVNSVPVPNKQTEDTATIDDELLEIASVCVPDIGNFHDVDVIEVSVSVGDTIQVNDTLITLETEKATMDVPADKTGVVTEIKVKVGDKVSQGDVIVTLSSSGSVKTTESTIETNLSKVPNSNEKKTIFPTTTVSKTTTTVSSQPSTSEKEQMKAHAGPAVRKLARELGVDLLQITGTAPHGRIVKEDVQNYVKQQLQFRATNATGTNNELDLLPWPKIDFSQFGPIENKPLGRIKKISGKNLARNWVMIPHVTQNDDADLTALEQFRKELNQEWSKENLKVSPLAFIIQASVKALQTFPEFNASLNGEELILKKYYHIGFAADTPNGLVVPVIKNVDQKGLKEICLELSELSQKARSGKLSPLEMQGASFTISSLGGIGGTYFTPIINAPEVAILGVCRSQIKPVWDGNTFQPRLMCPLSLSYDHRVIDGALACRFISYLSTLLADYKRLLL